MCFVDDSIWSKIVLGFYRCDINVNLEDGNDCDDNLDVIDFDSIFII